MIEFKKYYKLYSYILFFMYIIIVFYVVFFKNRFVMGSLDYKVPFSFYWENSVNLKPFRTIKNYMIYKNNLSSSIIYGNIIGNIILFIPFGCLLPTLISKKRKLLKTLGASFIFSLSIEAMQMTFRVGSFDIDDIILNILGGIVGYIIYYLVRRCSGVEI